ncbi:autotransporter outer membrane beta-barrel domain-containing protein [Megasphaera butyrica]|uniref:autotransporter outer membrane beta-barrel domain-containing protein n=1 Tax=Megasphaera butyrica TaxID=2981791 RepID=UPI002265B50E|nr:autotransporter outer membrane beta-barrel domain-containing protein [Megasphaera butyrica]MCU6713525.1 autotransporter outer membrane beta-barrel domain-containing protein [Megasphaera butyrica]
MIASDGDNTLNGAVYAIGDETNVQISGLADENGIYGNSCYNYVGSAAVIENAGGLKKDDSGKFTNTEVVSALYAEEGANIVVSGERNEFRSYAADPTDTGTLERTIWAYDKANIEINGSTLISTDRYEETAEAQKGNSADIAIAAGTAVNLTKDMVNAEIDDAERAKVTLNYGANSEIKGDILAAYAGQVDIAAKSDVTRSNSAKIDITGNLLAGNNGVLNVNLGNGGTLIGRADDYGDAGMVENSGHGTANEEGNTFFNPAFSSNIYKGGEVNLIMGSDSTWEVTGQSWITSVNTLGSENVVINLTSAKSDLNEKARALTIGEMKGDAVFSMRLDGDRSASDMLYIKNANNGKYFINLENPVTVEDMYNGFDGLRFATVGKGSHATFSAGTYDNGVYNVEYEVGTDDYDGNKENSAYNSTNADGEMDAAKPGNALVDNLFKDEPQEVAANGIMTLAVVASPDSTDASDTTENMGTNTDMNGKVLNDETNFKLIGVKSTELSDAGKTVVAMSKVNYANAIYMDRLNKRMGEARYIDGDEGLWVRIRHDRIGKSDAFRSKNTMMELGYDKRVDDREDGEHRRGFAIDYMRGTTDYHNVAGDGDVRRGGLWLYDTWLGNKGHYSDYVLKIGRLSNDFEVYARSTGEKITGDYSNFVYSASAEYGRKKDIGKDWYFEPQVQLQYAHVTDADYTTSQGTSVELDAIDSIIGRVGFRLGKDMGENNTFYVKADVLHEFLGDQDISAFDDTGRLDTTYENEGTWYDVGLGFSHQFSKGTYMFLDVEKTFGNDNEDTYQFNVGMNWKV